MLNTYHKTTYNSAQGNIAFSVRMLTKLYKGCNFTMNKLPIQTWRKCGEEIGDKSSAPSQMFCTPISPVLTTKLDSALLDERGVEAATKSPQYPGAWCVSSPYFHGSEKTALLQSLLIKQQWRFFTCWMPHLIPLRDLMAPQ